MNLRTELYTSPTSTVTLSLSNFIDSGSSSPFTVTVISFERPVMESVRVMVVSPVFTPFTTPFLSTVATSALFQLSLTSFASAGVSFASIFCSSPPSSDNAASETSSDSIISFLTFTVIVSESSPLLTVISVFPFLTAVTFPSSDTVATDVSPLTYDRAYSVSAGSVFTFICCECPTRRVISPLFVMSRLFILLPLLPLNITATNTAQATISSPIPLYIIIFAIVRFRFRFFMLPDDVFLTALCTASFVTTCFSLLPNESGGIISSSVLFSKRALISSILLVSNFFSGFILFPFTQCIPMYVSCTAG